MKIKTQNTLMKVGLASAVGVCFAALISIKPMLGMFPFGPESEVEATVTKTYVDVSISKDSDGNSHSSSHYMVGTDKGVFEVDNSLWLWIWNADEIYGSLENGKTYKLTTKGKKFANFFMQQYPRIVKVESKQHD